MRSIPTTIRRSCYNGAPYRSDPEDEFRGKSEQMMADLVGEVTQLLINWSKGDPTALDKLVPVVSAELRRIARRYMSRQKRGHTLQTSALINEAYLRLIDQHSVQWKDRAHFFAMSAQVMRNILIDHARKYSCAKRGAGARKVALDEAVLIPEKKAAQLVALDEALDELATVDPRKSRIVELRFFGGLSIEETAEVIGISPATVHREWRAARAWLQRAVQPELWTE
jgi:RNA polymerase sigma factor (TIGR02999 family)